ncbi:MAG TPA: hypothetical protein VFA79_03770 [Myxococcales bacterium]|nr:hypothetical protein [Myxococcales bacterium]
MNILDYVAIRVRCAVCSSEYSVPASVVLAGQQAISHGCPGCSDYECEARFVATLVESQVLKDLQAAWAVLEENVAALGGAGVTLVAVPTAAPATREDQTERARGALAQRGRGDIVKQERSRT